MHFIDEMCISSMEKNSKKHKNGIGDENTKGYFYSCPVTIVYAILDQRKKHGTKCQA